MSEPFASQAHRRLHLLTRLSRLRREPPQDHRSAAHSACAGAALRARQRELRHLEALMRADENGETEDRRD